MVIFFILATFFTQITMFNMLIAIMGDTFANAMEYRLVNGIRMKLAILNEQAPLLSKSDSFDESRTFVFVAKPLSDTLDEDQWNGTINKITNVTKRQISQLQKDIERVGKTLHENNKSQFDRIDSNFSRIEASFKSEVSEIKTMLKTIIEGKAGAAAKE